MVDRTRSVMQSQSFPRSWNSSAYEYGRVASVEDVVKEGSLYWILIPYSDKWRFAHRSELKREPQKGDRIRIWGDEIVGYADDKIRSR